MAKIEEDMKSTEKFRFEDAGRELPFKVPENYFEQFAAQIDRQTGYAAGRNRILKPWMYAVAAVLVGFAIITPVMYNKTQTSLVQTNENYESYVLSQVDETVMMDYYVDQDNSNK